VNAVEFNGVSKAYPVYDSPRNRLVELLTFGAYSRHRKFLALDNLSFTVAPGEVFCIVGANGSGKSTLLQIVAGVMSPSSGEVRVAGRVAALLELGAGFNPEFTGRDNVYLNGTVHGFSKREIDRRFAEIETFAEIGEYIDRPVKTYSSGMVVRLAFAVAISVEPEVLIVDEALAVGDTYFRHKCMRRVHELKARGTTILFVSHAVADVKAIGDRALWLERGRLMALGGVDDVVERYLAAMDTSSGNGADPARAKLPMQRIEPVRTIANVDHRHGNGAARILGIALLGEFGDPLHLMAAGHRTLVRISVEAHARLAHPEIGFIMRNHLGLEFSSTSTSASGNAPASLEPGEIVTVDFLLDTPELYPGAFSFSPYVRDREAIADWIDNAVTVQMARGEGPVYGYVQLPCRIEVNAHWPAGNPHSGHAEPSIV
jgi:ABC-type polysaccharide/polyol phosphate transport system ATPase subunit